MIWNISHGLEEKDLKGVYVIQKISVLVTYLNELLTSLNTEGNDNLRG